MLPTLGAPSKKSTPEQQMAMMRTYLNQLKDDTEGELYNIRWENLAKPLQDKLNGLDKDIVAQSEQFDYLNANMVSVGYLQANYLTANQIAANYVTTTYLESDFVYTGELVASQITSGTISTTYLDSSVITTDNLSAQTIQGSQITGLTIAANQITSGTIAAARLDADIIAGKFVVGNGSKFGKINSQGYSYVIGGVGYDMELRQVQKAGGGTIYALCATSTPPI